MAQGALPRRRDLRGATLRLWAANAAHKRRQRRRGQARCFVFEWYRPLVPQQAGRPMRMPRQVPNLLSLSRILLVPLLVVVLLTKFEGKEFVGLGVFLLASATDLLDGLIARRFRLETRLGKLLDPAADK